MRDLGDIITSGLIDPSGDYDRLVHQERPRSHRGFYHETSILRMRTLQSGFTLIELLIVIAIIGILAAVALPYYEGYMIRARLVEVENAMATVKSAVSSYRQEKDIWPDCSDIAAIRTSLGVGLAAIQRISAANVTVGGGGATITATVGGINAMVDGKTISLRAVEQTDSSISWFWEYDATFPPQLRQKPR